MRVRVFLSGTIEMLFICLGLFSQLPLIVGSRKSLISFLLVLARMFFIIIFTHFTVVYFLLLLNAKRVLFCTF